MMTKKEENGRQHIGREMAGQLSYHFDNLYRP